MGCSRRHVLLGAASLVAGCATPTTVPLDDRLPAFWSAYDATRDLPMPQRAQRLADGYFASERALYAAAGIQRVGTERIAAWLAGFDPLAAEVRALHPRFLAAWAGHVARFRAAFPDFDPAASPVHLMMSLWGFDAHLEPAGARLPLFFGLDGIVRYHGAGADLSVLMAHEMFHCYQGQRRPELSLDPSPPLYVGIWLEGVATYASERMNPGAPLREVLLGDDALLEDGPKSARRMAQAALERIDSTADADASAFLAAGWKGAWPARGGYFLGLLAARRAEPQLTLSRMAGLSGVEVRARVVDALGVIARGES